MKNIAVFCKDREQMHDYIMNVCGQFIVGVCWSAASRTEGATYHYMNGYMHASQVKGIIWDAVVYLPKYECRPNLIEQVNLNLRSKPEKSKREVLIEELEQKLAELKKEEGYE